MEGTCKCKKEGNTTVQVREWKRVQKIAYLDNRRTNKRGSSVLCSYCKLYIQITELILPQSEYV